MRATTITRDTELVDFSCRVHCNDDVSSHSLVSSHDSSSCPGCRICPCLPDFPGCPSSPDDCRAGRPAAPIGPDSLSNPLCPADPTVHGSPSNLHGPDDPIVAGRQFNNGGPCGNPDFAYVPGSHSHPAGDPAAFLVQKKLTKRKEHVLKPMSDLMQ